MLMKSNKLDLCEKRSFEIVAVAKLDITRSEHIRFCFLYEEKFEARGEPVKLTSRRAF